MPAYESGTVGGSARLSTWGKFRVTFARNARAVNSTTAGYAYSIEYSTGLKADGDGSGWIRKPPPYDGRGSAIDWQPCFFAGTYYPPPTEEDPDPDPVGQVNLNRGQQSVLPPVSDELLDYLTGGTIYSDGGNATMDSTFWSNNSSALVASPATTVTSVDGLVDI